MIFFYLSILTLNHPSKYLFIIFFLNKVIISYRSKLFFIFFIADLLYRDFVVNLLRRVIVSSWYDDKRFRFQNIFDLIEISNHDH